MFTLSYLSAIFGGLFLLLLGWFVRKLTGNRQSRDLEPKFLALEKEYNLLEKAVKKHKGQTEQLRKTSESWKHEFHALTQESQQKLKEHREQVKDVNGLVKTYKEENGKLKIEKDKNLAGQEKLRAELNKLKEKYKKDVADGKEWRNERDKKDREIKDLSQKLERQTNLANEYQKKYDKQAEEISKIRVMEREMRSLNTKTRTLEKDVTYWEKKHYDTHHELAELKKHQETMNKDFHELKELKKGDEILKSNLLEQIQEFKSKFVDVNNKYREMINSHN